MKRQYRSRGQTGVPPVVVAALVVLLCRILATPLSRADSGEPELRPGDSLVVYRADTLFISWNSGGVILHDTLPYTADDSLAYVRRQSRTLTPENNPMP